MEAIDDFCVDCPQGCINCGRKYVHHFVCDGKNCDADTLDGETRMYEDGSKHYCLKCLIIKHIDEFVDDLEEECLDWAWDNYDIVE